MRAQVSVEYIMITILLLGAIAVMSVASSLKSREVEIASLQLAADGVLRQAGNAINTVYLEGDGFGTNVTLPDRIAGFDYSVSTSSNFLFITIQGATYSRPLLTNATGSLAKGSNNLTNVKGEVRIR